jgi:hypothetical protein
MKKILTILLVCSFYGLNAQTITFDYNTRISTNTNLTNGNVVSYKINNINTYANKVIINGTPFSLNTDMPSDLTALFKIKTEEASNSLDETNKKVKEMEMVSDEVAEKAVGKATGTSEDNAKAEMLTLTGNCNNYYKEALKINDALSLYKRMAETMSDKQINTKILMLRTLNSKNINSTTINALKVNINNFKIAYQIVYRQYAKAARASKKAGDEVNETKIENAEDIVEKEYFKLLEQYEKIIDNIDDLFIKANDDNTYTAISPPLQAIDADEVEFETKIGSPTDDFSKITPFIQTFNVAGGMRLDYSIGPVFKPISDDVYYFDSSKKLQKVENTNSFTPSIATMMHLLNRKAGYGTWGGMFGINADFKEITDVNVGFLGGLSFVFGRKQKVFFSTGISFTKVSRLKEGQFKVGTEYKETDIASVTEKVLRPALFVSLSLSIAKRNKIK